MSDAKLAAPYLPVNPDLPKVVPELLRSLRRWTGWVAKPGKKPGAKPAKVPLSVTNDSTTWKSLEEALALPGTAGVGLQMLGASTFCGIDIDGCLNPETGAFNPVARSLLDSLPETYAEVTPSGRGLRIFALVPPGTKVPEFLSKTHGVECYVGKSARYLTVTGRVLEGRAGKLADLTEPALRILRPISSAVKGEAIDLEVKLPQPAVERQAEWEKLLPRGLSKPHRTFLLEGDIPGARSETTFAIILRLLEARVPVEIIFTILISAPGSWEAALDKRDQDVTRARSLIWADIGRAQKVVRADDDDLQRRIEAWQGLGLKVEVKGKQVVVLQSQANGMRILTETDEWKGRLALDTATAEVLLDGEPLDDPRFFGLQERVSMFAGWSPNSLRQWWGDLVRAAAGQNPRNPRASYLRSLSWDGVQRLDSWFVEHVTAEDTPLDRLIGRKWLISLVARWLDPGCKCDSVLVLQGEEGAFKTTFFETIAGSPSRVTYLDGFEKDDKLAMARAWIVEVPEAHLFKRADRNRLKAFITKPTDDYRPPYAANSITVARASVMVSTCNPGDLFTADQDGLRRFWLVPVRMPIDLGWIQEHRDQLLAEAVLAYDLEEPWWFDTVPAELKARVGHAMESTAIDEALVALIQRRAGQGGMSLTEIMSEVQVSLGYRPAERYVAGLLVKHGILKRRNSQTRFFLHPSWARPGVSGEADVIPLTRPRLVPVEKDDEVLS